ncbi:sigma 54-interacting transcriptional regulator [Pedobacter sp. WC2423]|uniref:sigma 54-interacting transcriptional regulator n=1 Tax=Pedobacter sp. WC2423 TaxID=3234142 RepID=UPI00346579C6
MTDRILIVEDEFIVAHDLKMILTRAGYEIAGIADSVKTALIILGQQEVGLVLLDIFLKGKQTGIDLANILMDKQIAFIYISANSNEKVMEAAKSTMPYGFIVKPYRDKDVLLSIDIARYRMEHVQNLKISSKLFMEDFIADVSMKPLNWKKKLLLITGAFQAYLPFDFLTLTATTNDSTMLSKIGIARKQFNEYDMVSADELAGNLKSNLVKSIILSNGDCITLSFYSKLDNIFKREHSELLNLLESTLAKNLLHIIEFEKVSPFKKNTNVPEKNKIPFPVEEDKFKDIIGQSPALLNLLDQLMIVAPTDTSVLITGESGTGKELIVQNLHRLSTRKNKPLVAVNCAALPNDLMESILFGHEKDAFAGATSQSMGKFEEASGGTIFLDEIGEMPFDLQAKLLRVLQQKEIERVGGKNPVPVDLRIIAATNLQLEKEISKGKFRLDLFFRLNVFPLHVPSLRARKEDIPILVAYFIEKHAKLLDREISGISSRFME